MMEPPELDPSWPAPDAGRKPIRAWVVIAALVGTLVVVAWVLTTAMPYAATHWIWPREYARYRVTRVDEHRMCTVFVSGAGPQAPACHPTPKVVGKRQPAVGDCVAETYLVRAPERRWVKVVRDSRCD
jgi:hypothetical protein